MIHSNESLAKALWNLSEEIVAKFEGERQSTTQSQSVSA